MFVSPNYALVVVDPSYNTIYIYDCIEGRNFQDHKETFKFITPFIDDYLDFYSHNKIQNKLNKNWSYV